MKNIKLKDNERIDDLQYKGLKIIQNPNYFCFGIDSILLVNFANNLKKNSKVVDLGTGSGIIGMLLCEKTKLKEIIGVEIQDEISDMALRSIKMNNLENKFKIINNNIKNIIKDKNLNKNEFDVVVMNPPYKELGTGVLNINNKKLIARHEIEAKLSDFIEISSELLKDKGEIYLVHKPERLTDIIFYMKKNNIEAKELRVVYSNKNSKASLILIKGVKGGKNQINILKPLIIYNEDGSYTNEIKEIYNN